MQSEKPVTTRLSAVRKDMLRGDSLFAVTIFAVVAVFLFNLVASLWNNVVFQKDVKEKASVQRVKAVGGMLAKAAETLIAADELSMLRRTVAEAGVEYSLRSCRIVLPDGAGPGGRRSRRHHADPVAAVVGGSAREDTPRNSHARAPSSPSRCSVPGRGSATLEVAAQIDDPMEALAPQTAQMAIACLALASMLLVHRHARFRLKAIGAIHEILLAVKDGAADFATLELDPSLGSEAVAWNKLLGERQNMQIRTAIEQVKEAVHERSETAAALEAVFDTAPYGLILVNENLTIEHANGAAAVFLQAERDQLIHARSLPGDRGPASDRRRAGGDEEPRRQARGDRGRARPARDRRRAEVRRLAHPARGLAGGPDHHRGHHAAAGGRGRHEQLPGEGRPRAAHAADEYPPVRRGRAGTVRARSPRRRASP